MKINFLKTFFIKPLLFCKINKDPKKYSNMHSYTYAHVNLEHQSTTFPLVTMLYTFQMHYFVHVFAAGLPFEVIKLRSQSRTKPGEQIEILSVSQLAIFTICFSIQVVE